MSDGAPKFRLDEMVACAERELALRRRVYPQWVQSGRMSQGKADEEIAKMAAVVDYLKGDLDRPNLMGLARPFAEAARGLEDMYKAIRAAWTSDESSAWAIACYALASRLSPAQWLALRRAMLGD